MKLKINLENPYARKTVFILSLATFCTVILGILYMDGVRINTTKSINVGVYWTSSLPIKIGSYVSFCPPEKPIFELARERGYVKAGFCPGGYRRMMKKILAAKYDLVETDESGVWVNGVLLAYSKLQKNDPGNRELPRYNKNKYILKESELLMMSDVSSTSFDARYFGPIEITQVESVITPVFTW